MYITVLITIGPVLNAWFNNCVLRVFFAYIANSIDAAARDGVLLLDLSIDCESSCES